MDEQMFTMKSEVVGLPSIVSDDLVQRADQIICEGRSFTNQEVSCEFPQISSAVLYAIIKIRPGSYKWVPKMLTGVNKTQRMASASTFQTATTKVGDEFLNHVVRVTDDETWVSFVNVETKEHSAVKAVDAHMFIKQAE
jgi:hypothetical protein